MTPDQPYSSDSPEADALLDAATAALRDMAVTDGPSDLLVQRTRVALREPAAVVVSQTSNVGRALPAIAPLGGQSPPYEEHISLVGSAPRTANLGDEKTVRSADSTLMAPARLGAAQRGGRGLLLRIAAVIAILAGAGIVSRIIFHHGDTRIVKAEPKQILPNPIGPKVAPILPTRHIEPPTLAPVAVNSNPPILPVSQLADGVIAGRVLFGGAAPRPQPLSGVNLMPDCEKLHGGPIYDESLVVASDGGLANVVVSISSGLSGWLREEFPPPSTPAVLNQRGCVFEPHVVAVMVGEPLLIKNSDPMLHNVHVMAVNNPAPNLGQPSVGELATSPFESPEVFRVKCDVHPWMQAWVRVVDNPYFAVTGRDGRFTLRGLPPGTYTLKAWHEQLGIREMQITIGPGHGVAADFVFKSSAD